MNQLESLKTNLEVVRRELLSEINDLSFDELNRSIEGDSWSIAQICHHLYLAETLFAKAIVNELKNEDSKKADAKPIHLLTDRSMKVNAPDIVKPSNKPQNFSQLTALLEESRALLFSVLDGIKDPAVLETKSQRHPFFGRLSLNQWIETIYLHEQRHIEQIKEVKDQVL